MAGHDSYAKFTATRWTLIDALSSSDEAARREAGAQLTEQYLSPVYAYIRSKGYPREEASELTQSFFADVIYQRDLFGQADQARGRLRTLLKAAVDRHLIDMRRRQSSRRKREVCASVLEAAEGAFQELQGVRPEDVFERRWAAAVLGEALNLCYERFVGSGQQDRFEVFEHWFCTTLGLESANRSAAQQFAEAHDLDNPDQVYAIARRVRLRLREALHEVLRQQVNDPQEVDEELREFGRINGVEL
jgi:DNA-directed RNA polymerase specialized sigma24 family protein